MFNIPQFQAANWQSIDVVRDPYFKYNTLAINTNYISQTNNATNNSTFIDSSVNNFTLTPFGTPIQGSFTPLYPNSWSGYFSGGHNLSIASFPVIAAGSDFTIEGWVRPTAASNSGNVIVQNSSTNYYAINFSPTSITIWVNSAAATATITDLVPAINIWHHIALVRQSGTIKFYLNGIASSTTISNNTQFFYTGGTLFFAGLAASQTGGTAWPGYMSNFRVVSGQALYTGNFTPAVSSLTINTVGGTGVNVVPSLTGNVTLLTLQDRRFKDNSSNNFTLTSAGGTQIIPTSPFLSSYGVNALTYSPSAHDGSIYFDGSSAVRAPAGSAFAYGTGAFTVEAWIYPVSFGTTDPVIYSQVQSLNNYFLFNIVVATKALQFIGSGATISSTGAVGLNQWNHVAVVREGTASNQLKLYLNGVLVGQGTSNTDFTDTTRNPSVGAYTHSVASGTFYGHIADLRVVKGTAVYTGAFTPSTSPLSAIANTSLLVRGNNGAIIDTTGRNNIQLISTTQANTTLSKFGAGSLKGTTGCIKFNGTSDYITVPQTDALILASGTPFTIEGWFYPTAAIGGVTRGLVSKRLASIGGYLCYEQATNGFISFYNGSTISQSTGKLTLSAWNYIAYVYDGANLSIYKDGSRIFNPTSVSITNATTPLLIGYDQVDNGYFPGYIGDVRITKGIARYSGASFIPRLVLPTN